MAGHHDRDAVVRAGTRDRARALRRAERRRELRIAAGFAARDLHQRIPHLLLERGADQVDVDVAPACRRARRRRRARAARGIRRGRRRRARSVRLREFRAQAALPAPAASSPSSTMQMPRSVAATSAWPSAVSTMLQRMLLALRRRRGNARASCQASRRRLRTRATASRSRRRTARALTSSPSRSARLQCAELALREVCGRAEAEARGEAALQVRGAQADGVAPSASSVEFAAVEQAAGVFELADRGRWPWLRSCPWRQT